jgi:hypothetical protein
MPALTPHQHHHRHSLLRLLWLEAPIIFSILSPAEQWDLHELYRPSEHLTEAGLAAHLVERRQAKPSLASKVGKTYKLIERIQQSLVTYGIPLSDHQAIARVLQPLDQRHGLHAVQSPETTNAHSGRGDLTVWPIVKPELDIERVSRAFVALVTSGKRDGSAWDLPPGSEDDTRAA